VSEPNDRTAWQRFLPSGPFALLPVRGGLHNIVWSTTHEAARTLEKMGPEEFAEAANKALRLPLPSTSSSSSSPLSQAGDMVEGLLSRLAATQSLPQRYQDPPLIESWVGTAPKSFPLHLKHATRYVLPRFALIGDAAHAVHPLAGQGVNLGLGDAEALADAIVMARKSGSDIGDPLILEEMYEKPRRAANDLMITALDSIKTAFSVQFKPFAAARNLGLDLINRSPSMRDTIMAYAMGKKPRPRLF
jgi:ubiquinone biosynthesis monooxygenase Coq6